MELIAINFMKNKEEYLALTQSGRIIGDQMEFMKRKLSSKYRLFEENIIALK